MALPMPRLRAPVVLVHGLFGFAQLRVARWWKLDYFHGIPGALEAAGNRVGAARLSPTRGVAYRAAQLRDYLIQHFPGEPVHLLAHSMGGLDARYMITHLGMEHAVRTLTTLGTPHRGSSFADWAMQRLARLVAPIFDALNISREAFADLTTSRCAQFNLETPNVPSVRYYSIAGEFCRTWRTPSWSLSEPIVSRLEGPNDGIVSLTSARWGIDCEIWAGDHVSLINWTQPGVYPQLEDRLTLYARHLARLQDEGE